MNNVMRKAMASAVAWLEYQRQARNQNWCRCPRLWKQDSLAAFAPPAMKIEKEPLPLEAYELFCSRCGRARTMLELVDFAPDPDYKP